MINNRLENNEQEKRKEYVTLGQFVLLVNLIASVKEFLSLELQMMGNSKAEQLIAKSDDKTKNLLIEKNRLLDELTNTINTFIAECNLDRNSYRKM